MGAKGGHSLGGETLEADDEKIKATTTTTTTTTTAFALRPGKSLRKKPDSRENKNRHGIDGDGEGIDDGDYENAVGDAAADDEEENQNKEAGNSRVDIDDDISRRMNVDRNRR